MSDAVPQYVCHHLPSKRDIFLLEVGTLNLLRLRMPTQFACFCCTDAGMFSTDEIARFCENLLRSGCVYLSTWGPGCSRVHDIMDETLVSDNPPESEFDDIMTTWHEQDSFDEALDFFLFDTQPYEYSEDACRSGLIIADPKVINLADIGYQISMVRG